MADSTKPDVPKTRGWVKILLFVSLSLNLLVVGMVAGAIYRGGPDDRRGPPHMARIDLGLGPYGNALSRADRRVLRRAIGEGAFFASANRADIRLEMRSVLAALRQVPFDPNGLRDTMGQQQNRLVQGQNVGKDALLKHLSEMAAPERQVYADRLEKVLGRFLR